MRAAQRTQHHSQQHERLPLHSRVIQDEASAQLHEAPRAQENDWGQPQLRQLTTQVTNGPHVCCHPSSVDDVRASTNVHRAKLGTQQVEAENAAKRRPLRAQ